MLIWVITIWLINKYKDIPWYVYAAIFIEAPVEIVNSYPAVRDLIIYLFL